MNMVRNLILVFGDQLSHSSAAFHGFDIAHDQVWMAEVPEENTHVWCHKQRITLFLSAMRHFRNEMKHRGLNVHYSELAIDPSDDRGASFADLLRMDMAEIQPERVIFVQPGDLRVQHAVESLLSQLKVRYEMRSDDHFLTTPEEFAQWAKGKKSLVMEFFYRWVRKKHGILLSNDGQPEGGQWNYDSENRESFGKQGPTSSPAMKIRPDATTEAVRELVESRFSEHPGMISSFGWPVSRDQALMLLQHFVTKHLPEYGRWQDAMWTNEPFLDHSRLSSAMNLKLISPRECVDAALAAWRSGKAPLNSVEGFVRQIIGWREFIRGIYFLKMPNYAGLNFFKATRALPQSFWDGHTEMNCVRSAMQNVLQQGWTHHIERLMVLGNFAQLWGTDPIEFHQWHMAMYVDAIDWVSLPNTLGMSQFGDGGIVGTKPYCSSGNYIHKMSNFCQGCKFDYRKRTGADACPFTTLYWHFLDRHSEQLQSNPRMKFAMANLKRVRNDEAELKAIQDRADVLFQTLK